MFFAIFVLFFLLCILYILYIHTEVVIFLSHLMLIQLIQLFGGSTYVWDSCKEQVNRRETIAVTEKILSLHQIMDGLWSEKGLLINL